MVQHYNIAIFLHKYEIKKNIKTNLIKNAKLQQCNITTVQHFYTNMK